jgi:hypothetical protein
MNQLSPHLADFNLDAFPAQFAADFLYPRVNNALFMRAAVKCNNFHNGNYIKKKAARPPATWPVFILAGVTRPLFIRALSVGSAPLPLSGGQGMPAVGAEPGARNIERVALAVRLLLSPDPRLFAQAPEFEGIGDRNSRALQLPCPKYSNVQFIRYFYKRNSFS